MCTGGTRTLRTLSMAGDSCLVKARGMEKLGEVVVVVCEEATDVVEGFCVDDSEDVVAECTASESTAISAETAAHDARAAWCLAALSLSRSCLAGPGRRG